MSTMRSLWMWAVVVSLLLSTPVLAKPPLHEQIDQLIEAKIDKKQLAEPADDATFLRRAYLDFAGRIPSASETRAFLNDKANNKRTKLIDQLLNSPEYARHMTDLFNSTLMERLGEDPKWRAYLEASFAENKPWDKLVGEILNPVAGEETKEGVNYFFVQRLSKYGANPVDYPGLTRDVSRLFLGQDLQCAQCHDHLFINDYEQLDFQGLHAAFINLTLQTDKESKAKIVVEQPMKAKLEFVSVFDPTERETGPRVPGGKSFDVPEVEEEQIEFSPVRLIADELPNAQNDLFTRNAVNRLWFSLMGRGLVHPLDLMHSDNSPSHPKLLDLLAKEFVANKFNIKWLQRELALTRTYARSSRMPAEAEEPPPESFAVALERRILPEPLLKSVLQATGPASPLKQLKDTDKPIGLDITNKELCKEFLSAFANERRDPEVDFRATVAGALYLLNGDHVLALLEPHKGNLVDRLNQIKDDSKVIDELFLTVLSRYPTDEERTDLGDYLAAQPKRTEAIGQIAWAMLASVEFATNH